MEGGHTVPVARVVVALRQVPEFLVPQTVVVAVVVVLASQLAALAAPALSS